MYIQRLERLRCKMEEQDIDLLLLTPSSDLFYLTGINERMMERLVLLAVDRQNISYIAPAFEIANLPQAPHTFPHTFIQPYGWKDGEDPFTLAKQLLPPAACRIAVGRSTPSWILIQLQAMWPTCQWVTADGLMQPLRAIKDQHEYQMLKKAQACSCKAFEKLLQYRFIGIQEKQIAKQLVDLLAEEGMTSGLPIVASGPNSALPHYHTGERVIQPGDVVVIDFGGSFPAEGYKADTTRTLCVGHIPQGFQTIYDITLEANQAAFHKAQPHILCSEVDLAARHVIEAAGYGPYFTHRLGHGLGLDGHEAPYISADNQMPIQAGNAFSDEPGIYLPRQFGVRIEDQLFINENGAECITPLGHSLIVVE